MSKLNKQLNNLKQRGTPSKEFSKALRSQLSVEFDCQHQTVKRPVWRFAFASAMAVVVLLTTGTGVYAYDSPEVIEGHSLYQVKNNMERVEEWFAHSPKRQAAFQAKMLNRRLNEARHFRNRPEFTNQILDKAANRIDRNGGFDRHLKPKLREIHDRIRGMNISREERHQLFIKELNNFITENNINPEETVF